MVSNKQRDIQENINKTGFILEYQVGKILTENGWKVISNKYYIDDTTSSVREIDILAYKAGISEGVRLYTCLMISCKKSEERDWIFLTKDINSLAPENNLSLLQWTNFPVFDYILNEDGYHAKLVNDLREQPFFSRIFKPDREVFAFQEMSKNNSKPQNDTNIFKSVETLIKATSYEMDRLTERRKEASLYNFHMISVADTDFFEAFINGDDIEVNETTYMLYKNQYIVNRIEGYYSIDFMTFKEFSNRLDDYDKIHDWNILFNSGLLRGYYDNLLTDRKSRSFFFDKFNISIDSVIKYHISKTERECLSIFSIDFRYQSELNTLFLSSEFIDESTATKYNNNIGLINDVAKWLRYWFRYVGKVAFEGYEHDEDDYGGYDEIFTDD